jgi:hypothetical protein
VTIKRDSLVWRSGLEGIATNFYRQTEIVLAGLKPHFGLLGG